MRYCCGGGRGRRSWNILIDTEGFHPTYVRIVFRGQFFILDTAKPFFFFKETLTWSGPKTKLSLMCDVLCSLSQITKAILSVNVDKMLYFPSFGCFSVGLFALSALKMDSVHHVAWGFWGRGMLSHWFWELVQAKCYMEKILVSWIHCKSVQHPFLIFFPNRLCDVLFALLSVV